MDRLILIRHSNPEIQPTISADQWHLSDEGKERAMALGPFLTQFEITRLYSSSEPKAVETADILGAYLERHLVVFEDLHEHRRVNVGWSTKEQFDENVIATFQKPGQLVFGEETGLQAASRMNSAVSRILQLHPDETIGVVSHGTVITLFVSMWNAIQPVQFWRALQMPCMVVIDRNTLELLETITPL